MMLSFSVIALIPGVVGVDLIQVVYTLMVLRNFYLDCDKKSINKLRKKILRAYPFSQ